MQIDSIVCPALLASGPTVNALGHPEVVRIDDDGDLFLLGELSWDCPPYTQGALTQ